MTQSNPASTSVSVGPRTVVQGSPLPGRTLSAAEQMEALRRVQAQAERRLRLGARFFQAAQAQNDQHRQVIEEIKARQETLREQMTREMTQSLRQYDQWVGAVERSATDRLDLLDRRLTALEEAWTDSRQRMTRLLRRAEMMLDQTRVMLERSLDTPPPTARSTEAGPAQARESSAAGETQETVELPADLYRGVVLEMRRRNGAAEDEPP